MTEKYYYDSPKVSDTIIFDIFTPDANCCFNADPFEVVQIKIYFVERNFSTDFYTQVNANIGTLDLEKKYLEASQNLCNDPNNVDYQNELKKAKRLLLNSANYSDIQFDNLVAIAVFGSDENPVWQASNPADSILYKIVDAGSNIAYGHFGFKFKQDALREGDYFLSVSWRPNVSLQKLSSNIFFSLLPDSYKYIIPANLTTDKKKYPELLNRYLPEVYKEKLTDLDLTPEVLSKFNFAVGDSFETMENLANNISGLIDYNLIPEYFLAYLGNLYRLNFYSDDTIKWRRQIAKAVPNFKMKGTLKGLKSALSDAGINLVKFTQLYQLYSKYIWTDVFYINDSNTVEFELSKLSLPINNENFEVYLRKGSGSFVKKSLSSINIQNIQFISILTWVGEPLKKGDTLKISYQIEKIKDPLVQSLENYLKTLPLADTRNDLEYVYPPKNWNAKVIAEDDQFFNELIPQKNPFHEPIVFGQIRTDFAYSENIYNMDEYNGSLRDSTNPCDIDKNFIDPCSGFVTTLFNCDLTIEDLSPERINEALQIIKEYKPFHAILHSLNYSGVLNDYVLPPEESIEALITYYGTENLLANYPQMLFARDMFAGLSTRKVTRSMVATQTNLGTDTVQGYNQKIVLYAPLVDFSDLSLGLRTTTLLEILSPSPNQGSYTVENPQKNIIDIYEQALIPQPINQSQFAFRLSLINYSGTNIDIKQRNVYVFSDLALKDAIKNYGVESKETNPNPWKIKYYTTYPTSFNVYDIEVINPDGSIVLDNDGTLPTLTQGLYINNITYELLNSSNEYNYTSFDGKLFCYNNGIVTVQDGNYGDSKERLEVGDWLLYTPNNEQYQILEYGFEPNVFVICSWNNGNVTGQSGKILSRIVNDTTGNLSYYGMVIEKPASLPIIYDPEAPNAVENNKFKENFILIIDDNLYKIEDYYTELSVNYLVLGGLKMDLTTQLSGGTSLNVQSIQLKKKNLSIITNQYEPVDQEYHLSQPVSKKYTEIKLNKIPVVDGSVEGSIYFNTELIQRFKFDGAGNFRSLEEKYSSAYAVNGTIDYATGIIVLTWNDIPINQVIFAMKYSYSFSSTANLCGVDRTGAVELSAKDQDGNLLNLCQSLNFSLDASLLSSLEKQGENDKFNDIIKQEEKIGFKIETIDGQTFEGKL